MDAIKEQILSQEPGSLAAEITDQVNRNLPNEKNVLTYQLKRTAQEIKDMKLAPTSGEGRGQACLSIPPLAYHRWNQLYPGCWTNKEFRDEWALDNPETVLPGYKPKAKTVYFDMGKRSVSFAATFYQDNKAKVNAYIAEIKKLNGGH